MMKEVEQIQRNNRKQLIEYYTTMLHNTIVQVFPRIQIQKGQLQELVDRTKDEYGITDELEAIKKTLHNASNLLIVFYDNIQRLRSR